jgi:tetratricopeptide (TPR) repeat protein
MADSQRIEDLRRRVQKDPASIAFAQLAEECRRAGQVEEAVDVCRAGLAIHPGYLSARVTLGRALIELNQLDDALNELTTVLRSAPENLAAIRGIAEIHHRRGDLADALAQYRAALALARNDPDLQQTVAELARQVEPPAPPVVADGLSFEQITSEFLKMGAPPVPPAPAAPPPEAPAPEPLETVDFLPPPEVVAPEETVVLEETVVPETIAHELAAPPEDVAMPADLAPPAPVEPVSEWPLPASPSLDDSAAREEATRTIAALEQWLDAIHVARANRSA